MQTRLRAVVMRGGTSRALFFRDSDLPMDSVVRDRIILAAFGSPDPFRLQLDGLGGATSTTSKVAVIGPGRSPRIDVEYTFGQVSISEAHIDRSGNCGNISSAVGPFAIDEGFVAATGLKTDVRFLNTNTGKVIVAHVPTREGAFESDGDFSIPGVPGRASEIVLDYLDPGGSVTGFLLPTGRMRDCLDLPGGSTLDISIVDAGNPVVFAALEDVGLTPDVSVDKIAGDKELLARLEAIRAQAAVLAGLAETADEATSQRPSVPKLALISRPHAYRQLDGMDRPASDVDLIVRSMSMGKPHSSYQLTAAICTAIAASLPGTLVSELAGTSGPGRLRIGHPSGVMAIEGSARLQPDGWRADRVSVSRTARRLMEGFVLIPDHLFSPSLGKAR